MSNIEIAITLIIIVFFMQDFNIKKLEKRVSKLEKE